jgi:hypothetical protein
MLRSLYLYLYNDFISSIGSFGCSRRTSLRVATPADSDAGVHHSPRCPPRLVR